MATATPAIARGIGNDHDGAHGGEVVRHDRGGQQSRGEKSGADVVAPDRDLERPHAEQHADRDRDQHILQQPRHMAWNLHRRHAEIMHTGDAASDHRAAERRVPARAAVDGDA